MTRPLRCAVYRRSLFVLLLCLGCAQFRGPQFLEKSRPLGVRLELADDPNVGEPAPGEAFRAELILGHPGPTPEVDWIIVACEAAPATIGVAFCVSEPFATASGSAAPGTEIRADFVVPDDFATRDGNVLLVGTFCAGGPVVDPAAAAGVLQGQVDADSLSACAADADPSAEGAFFTSPVPVWRGGVNPPNINPDGLTVELGGVALEVAPPPDAPTRGCDGGDFPEVSIASTTVTLRIEAPEAALETYEEPDGTEATEELIVAGVSSSGTLDRLFTIIDQDSLRRGLGWDLPLDVPDDGRLARMTFVARDGREGTWTTTVGVCLVP